jgi:hypothetical protein
MPAPVWVAVVAVAAADVEVEAIAEMDRAVGEARDLLVVRIQVYQRQRRECRREDGRRFGDRVEPEELLTNEAFFLGVISADEPFEAVALV